MAAITAGLDEPIAIIAGAGSGKTAVMAARVVWLVGHEGVAPERIIGLTFTNKAAAELGQRVRASLARLGDSRRHDRTGRPHDLDLSRVRRLTHQPSTACGSASSRTCASSPTPRGSSGSPVRSRPSTATSGTSPRTSRGSCASARGWTPSCPSTASHTDELRAFDARLIEVAESGVSTETVVCARGGHDRPQAHRNHLARRRATARRRPPTESWTSPTRWLGAPRWRSCRRSATPLRERFDVVLLDEYQDTSVAQRDLLVGAVPRHAGHGGRRPGPRHLRLARGGHRQPRGVPQRLP